MLVGHVAQIWRYPVKSMGGESIESALLGPQGIPGDRSWAVIDSGKGEICSAKRWPELLNYRAGLNGEEPAPGSFGKDLPTVSITCPDGTVIDSGDEGAGDKLREQLQRPAGLTPLAPPSDLEHYKLASKRTEESMIVEMGLLPGEPMPDFSASMSTVLESLAENVTPPGTYFDAYPLHLMSGNSLRFLTEQGGVGAVVERYRPNLLVEALEAEPGMAENEWVGHSLSIGDARLRIDSRTVRCSMPAREQQWCKLPAEPDMARAMVEHCDRHLGVNVLVEKNTGSHSWP
jgi:uncharacterized protein YcbX